MPVETALSRRRCASSGTSSTLLLVERESRAHGDGLTGMSGVATGEAEITHGGGEEVEGVQHDMAPQREGFTIGEC